MNKRAREKIGRASGRLDDVSLLVADLLTQEEGDALDLIRDCLGEISRGER